MGKLKVGDRGFDISHHQNITLAKMREAFAAGFRFTIIRASHGTSVDKKFEQHLKAAIDAGMEVLIYFYPYHATFSRFAAEVQKVIDVLGGRLKGVYIVIDMEHRGEYDGADYLSMLSKDEATDRALYAIDKIEAAGYKAGIYADVDWMRNEMYMDRIPEDVLIWCADWHGALDYKGRCEIRQITDKGTVPGIGTGSVDIDVILALWDDAPTAPAEEPCLFAIRVVKDTWIRDKPNGKKLYVAKPSDQPLGIAEVSGTWGRIQNQRDPAAWISINPAYKGVIRIK